MRPGRSRHGAGAAVAAAADPVVPPAEPDWAVLYTPAEIAAWTTGTEYNALSSRVNSKWGGNSRTITPKTAITTMIGAGGTHRDDAMYAKCQAVLWAVDGSSTRLAKVTEVLDSVKNVTSITENGVALADGNGQGGNMRLELSWTLPNLVQAAHIIGYQDDAFDVFCRYVFPLFEWRTGGNWFASFSEARLEIAAYLRDEVRWAEAEDFFDYHITRVIYHSDYDGLSIVPVTSQYWPASKTGTVSTTLTASHWWNAVTASPWTATYAGWTFDDGTDCEFRRDPDHESMTMAGFCNSARTIVANGYTVPAHAHQRIKEFARFNAEKVLYYLNNSEAQLPGTPQWAYSFDGDVMKTSWFVAATYLGVDTPADVTALTVHSAVTSNWAEGLNYLAGERMAEGSLL